jgi:hypothetical protein
MQPLYSLVVSLTLILTSLSPYAQIGVIETKKPITVGKVGGGAVAFVASLEYVKGDADVNKYMLYYNNLNYTQITDINKIVFNASENDLKQFYELLKAQFNAEKGTEKDFQLGNEVINVTTKKMLGAPYIQIITTDDGTTGFFNLTPKQLNKLFGYKEEETSTQ